MTEQDLNKLGTTLWNIANELRGTMDADDFRVICYRFCFCVIYRATTRPLPKKNWGILDVVGYFKRWLPKVQ